MLSASLNKTFPSFLPDPNFFVLDDKCMLALNMDIKPVIVLLYCNDKMDG